MTFTKVTLLGPAPWGGSTTIPLTTDANRALFNRLVAEGHRVTRTWEVTPYKVVRYFGDSGTWHPAPGFGDAKHLAAAEAWIAAQTDGAEYKVLPVRERNNR
jgi:hypothetical protein